MILGILSLLGLGGIPAILLGIAGKLGFSWLTGLMGGTGLLATILKPVVTLCIGLVDILLVVVKWLVKLIIDGLDYILKKPSAVGAVMVIAWVFWGLGKYDINPLGFAKSKAPTKIERSVSKKKAVPKAPAKKPSKSWMDSVLGN